MIHESAFSYYIVRQLPPNFEMREGKLHFFFLITGQFTTVSTLIYKVPTGHAHEHRP